MGSHGAHDGRFFEGVGLLNMSLRGADFATTLAPDLPSKSCVQYSAGEQSS